MSALATSSATCSLLLASSILLFSCTAQPGHSPEAAKRREGAPGAPGAPGASGEPGEPDMDTVKRTLDALVAEKRKAKKHYERGNGFFVRSEFEKALREYRRALDLSPRDPEYKNAVRKVEWALGRRPGR